MTDVFTETLHSWQNFYFMIGGAAAGLIGLMFVAVSLAINFINKEISPEARSFVTPSIVYFVSVLIVAGIMLVPTYAPISLAAILFLAGAVGLGQTVPHVRQLYRTARRHNDFTRWDWLAQIILPAASYALILLTALGFVIGLWSLAFMGVWLATLALLMSAIGNTWSLVTWIIERRGNSRSD